MRGRSLSGPVIERVATHPVQMFADAFAWRTHIAALDIDQLQVTLIATEGGRFEVQSTTTGC
jgi:hypothetical protein